MMNLKSRIERIEEKLMERELPSFNVDEISDSVGARFLYGLIKIFLKEGRFQTLDEFKSLNNDEIEQRLLDLAKTDPEQFKNYLFKADEQS